MHDTKLLLEQLDGLALVRTLYPEVGNPTPAGEVLVLCPFHADSRPSLGYNVLSNVFRCPACGASGDAIALYGKVKNLGYPAAIDELSEQFGLDSNAAIAGGVVEAYHAALRGSRPLLEELKRRKGITADMVATWRLGWDVAKKRLVIPVKDSRGRFVNLRFYDLCKLYPNDSKYFSFRKKGAARLFPAEALNGEEVHLVEGELKMIATRSRGFNALTTEGADTWDEKWTQLFVGKRVWIAYDVDTAGQGGATRLAAKLATVAAEVRNVALPLDIAAFPKGGIEDYWQQGYTAEQYRQLCDETPLFVPAAEVVDPSYADPNEYEVLLAQASQAWFYHRNVVVPVVVSAKDTAPYVVPKSLAVKCPRGGQPGCERCAVFDNPTATYGVEADKEELLELVEVARDRQQGRLRRLIGVPDDCRANELVPLESQNVEELRLVPQLDTRDGGAGGTALGGEQTVVKAYYVGHGLEANAPYETRGRVVADPEDQHATLILREAKPNVDSLSTFEPTPEQLAELRLFQPAEWTVEGLDARLDALYDDLEANVTRIYHRRFMHLLMDLVWHSVLYLPVNGEPKKGWLDALVIGDSGQGKSETSMRLRQHYGVGEWIDMKGASVAGLKGGLDESAGRWWVKWGAIPQNDRRLLVLDEVKGAAPEVLQALTSMRSSGLAEVQKIERRRAWARTRLLWISNPRSDRKVETYNYGVTAIKELLGSLEDVRRFDVAMVVATNEVTAGSITEGEQKTRPAHVHTGDLCRRLVLWAWSRDANRVCIDDAAVAACSEEAARQGARYSSSVPLVEPSDHRLKLLRLAAAEAARTFSASEDGLSLIVRECHVRHVAMFLDRLYESRFMGYDEYSKQQAKESVVVSEAVLRAQLLALPHCVDVLAGLARSNEIRQTDLSDWTGMDRDEVRPLLGNLVRGGALVRRMNSYYKSPPFIEALRLLVRDVESGAAVPNELSREY